MPLEALQSVAAGWGDRIKVLPLLAGKRYGIALLRYDRAAQKGEET